MVKIISNHACACPPVARSANTLFKNLQTADFHAKLINESSLKIH